MVRESFRLSYANSLAPLNWVVGMFLIDVAPGSICKVHLRNFIIAVIALVPGFTSHSRTSRGNIVIRKCVRDHVSPPLCLRAVSGRVSRQVDVDRTESSIPYGVNVACPFHQVLPQLLITTYEVVRMRGGDTVIDVHGYPHIRVQRTCYLAVPLISLDLVINTTFPATELLNDSADYNLRRETV